MNLLSLRKYASAAKRLLRKAVAEQDLRDRFPRVTFGDGVLLIGADKFFPSGRAFIDHRAYLNCAGGAWNDHAGYIRLGENVEIGPYSVLWGAGGITLGNNVHLGAHVAVTAHNSLQVPADQTDANKPLGMEFAPVTIDDHTLVSNGTLIAPGVHIGHHVKIGAGAVVVKDIPPYALAVGVPARVIKFLDRAEAEALVDPAAVEHAVAAALASPGAETASVKS